MSKVLRKRNLLLLILAGLLMACSRHNPISTQQPSKSTMTPGDSQATATTMQLPSPTHIITPTVIPLQLHDSNSSDAMEIIVSVWDSVSTSSPLSIPEIHIWKDGYAVWVDRGTDRLYHVDETFLSTDEIMRV